MGGYGGAGSGQIGIWRPDFERLDDASGVYFFGASDGLLLWGGGNHRDEVGSYASNRPRKVTNGSDDCNWWLGRGL